jgi:hypothetical protein
MEVTLKRNGWYNKLQSFVLGDAKPELYSLCPFFWLTIFCIFAAPFALIIKGVGRLGKSFFKNFEEITGRALNRFLDTLTFEDAVELNEDYTLNKKTPFILRKYSKWDLFYQWQDRMIEKYGDDYYSKFESAKLKYKERMEQLSELNRMKRREEEDNYEKARLKEGERKAFINKLWIPIVVWTQRVFNVLLTVVLMTLISLIINALVIYFNLESTLNGLKVIAITLLVIGILVGIIYLIRAYILYLIENEIVPFWLKPIVTFFRFIGSNTFKFFTYIGTGFSKFFGLFYEYFKANKNDYCPAINWDDEQDASN